ncbi:MAG: hypothetical protein ACP6IS_10005 [Candidatus Asgardarchaeia archaeon]
MIHFAFIYDIAKEKADKIGNINSVKSHMFPSESIRSLNVESFLLDLVKAPDDIFDKIADTISNKSQEKSIVVYKIDFNKKKIVIFADTLLDVKLFLKHLKNLSDQKATEINTVDVKHVMDKINRNIDLDKDKIDVASDIVVAFEIAPSKEEFCTGEIITVTINITNRSKIPIIITSITNLISRYIELIDSNFRKYTISGTSLVFDDGIHLSVGESKQIILKLLTKEEGSIELKPSLRYRDYDGMLYRPSSIGSRLIVIKRC